MNLKEKLEAYSEVSPSGCWEWQRSRFPTGYGRVSIGRQKQDYAHRVSYRGFIGPIPDGMLVRHKCDNPCCCNPEHLELGTQKDNMRDCMDRGRKPKPPVFIGEANNKTKLTEKDVEFIMKSSRPSSELARMFGVTPQAIYWRRHRDKNN